MAGLDGQEFRAAVRDLVLLSSSPRSGSSMLAGALRAAPGSLHLQGEVTPFLTEAGLMHPESGSGSDVLTAEHADGPAAEALAVLLAADTGEPGQGPAEMAAFTESVTHRLLLQWPVLAGAADTVRAAARAVSAEVPLDSPAAVATGLHAYWVGLLRRIREFAPSVDPAYYDLSPADLRAGFGDLPIPDGPPGHRLVEVPPFVLAQPWRPATAAELGSRPLVIKTPGNAYRFAFWGAFFPNARIRVLHLHRHPAAVVDSLARAWHYRGFFAHHLPGALDIEGYTDRHGDWARSWWNFDLPPGWPDHTGDHLEDLCAFQWWAAHDAIFRWTDAHPETPCIQVGYEDLCGTHRVGTLAGVLDWLGTPATRAAEFRREMVAYDTRSELDDSRLKLALDDPDVRRIAARLGYGLEA